MAFSSGRLQPMLIDLDIHGVGGGPGVVGPDVGLPEAYAVERLLRQAAAAVGQLLRVREVAQVALDHARLAADVVRRPEVAGRVGPPHAHRAAGGTGRAHDVSTSRASTSANFRPSSSA